jgi:hypothetical protein
MYVRTRDGKMKTETKPWTPSRSELEIELPRVLAVLRAAREGHRDAQACCAERRLDWLLDKLRGAE